MLALPTFMQLCRSFFTPRARPPAPAPSPSLAELRRQGRDFAEWFHSPGVQQRLPALKRRYEYLRHVGEELPRWLLTDAPPCYFDCETRWMPDDAPVREALQRHPGLNPIRAQRLAVATLIEGGGGVTEWEEGRAGALVEAVLRHPIAISFNGLAFDNVLLSAYGGPQLEGQLYARTLDLMHWLQWRRQETKPRRLEAHAWELLKKRKLPLTSLVPPAASVPEVFRRGRPEDLLAVRLYCWHDTELLRDLWAATRGTPQERRAFYAWWLRTQRERLLSELSRGPWRPTAPPRAEACFSSLA